MLVSNTLLFFVAGKLTSLVKWTWVQIPPTPSI
jgi:hypothetical protein